MVGLINEVEYVLRSCHDKANQGYKNSLVSLNACVNCEYAIKSSKDACGVYEIGCKFDKQKLFVKEK